MSPRPSLLIALTVCVAMTSGCAASVPTSPDALPPRLTLPAWAQAPCRLTVLQADATQAELDLAYADRGEALVDCDTARAMAVDVRRREHEAQGLWQAERQARRLPPWKRWLGLSR